MGVGHLVWLRVKCGPSGRSTVGGRAVAKILVADDNSNIQKMVGLALKDQGIDVVAVGNGEAAVIFQGQPHHLLDVTVVRSEEHTSELQSQSNLVCRLLLETK